MKFIFYKEPATEMLASNPSNIVIDLSESAKSGPYQGQEKIAAYLYSGGHADAATTSPVTDQFTGNVIETIDPQNGVTRTDGFYYWPTSLAYYVAEYNVRLPKEIEEHILRCV